MKRYFRLFLFTAITFLTVLSCVVDGKDNALTGVTVTASASSISATGSTALTASAETTGSPSLSYSWKVTSSGSEYAKVTGNGATAILTGTNTTSSAQSVKVKVTVTDNTNGYSYSDSTSITVAAAGGSGTESGVEDTSGGTKEASSSYNSSSTVPSSYSNVIYLDIGNAVVSSDNSSWEEITTSANEIISNVKVKFTEDDSGNSTNLIRVDATEFSGSLAVYISGTNNSSTVGGVKIQSNGTDTVAVFLNDASITSTLYPCVQVTKGSPSIFDVSGTSSFTDGRTSSSYDDDAKGTLYSNGSLTLSGSGSLSITQGFKNCIGTKGDLSIEGGTFTLTSTATPIYDSEEADYNSPALINVDGNITVSGGTITGTSSGNYNKGVNCDGSYTQTGGTVNISAKGSTNSSNSSYPSAKGMKIDGAITVSGGTLYASSAKDEAIESKSTITISGGEVYGYSTGDDAINSSGDMTISGGYVCGFSSANDGLDANGNMYIKGGVVYAVCTTTPEVALDANTEESKCLYIQGGTVITLGPIESGASLTQSCYQASSWSANTYYALTAGSATYVFKTPSTTSGYGSGIIVSASSTPTLTSGATPGGTSYFDGWLYEGGSAGSTSVTLSSYSGSSSGGQQGGGTTPGGSSGNPGGNSGGRR